MIYPWLNYRAIFQMIKTLKTTSKLEINQNDPLGNYFAKRYKLYSEKSLRMKSIFFLRRSIVRQERQKINQLRFQLFSEHFQIFRGSPTEEKKFSVARRYVILSGVLGVTKIFQMMQPITRPQFNITHFDWSNFCRSDQNFGHSEHTPYSHCNKIIV